MLHVRSPRIFHTTSTSFLFSFSRTISLENDGVPSRPDAERPQAEIPRPANPFAGGFGVSAGGVGAGGAGVDGVGIGALAGGQMHFQAGLGFFPSLFGLQFVSDASKMCWEPLAHVFSSGRTCTNTEIPFDSLPDSCPSNLAQQ